MEEPLFSAFPESISTSQNQCGSHSHLWDIPGAEERLPWQAHAGGEAELAAGHEGVTVVEASIADRAPGAVAEDLQGAGGEAVDVDPGHQPHRSLATCTHHSASLGITRLVAHGLAAHGLATLPAWVQAGGLRLQPGEEQFFDIGDFCAGVHSRMHALASLMIAWHDNMHSCRYIACTTLSGNFVYTAWHNFRVERAVGIAR